MKYQVPLKFVDEILFYHYFKFFFQRIYGGHFEMAATSAILNLRIGSEAKSHWYDLCNISAQFHAFTTFWTIVSQIDWSNIYCLMCPCTPFGMSKFLSYNALKALRYLLMNVKCVWLYHLVLKKTSVFICQCDIRQPFMSASSKMVNWICKISLFSYSVDCSLQNLMFFKEFQIPSKTNDSRIVD